MAKQDEGSDRAADGSPPPIAVPPTAVPPTAAPPAARSRAGGCLPLVGMLGVGALVLVTAVVGVVGGRFMAAPAPPLTTVVNAGPPVIVAVRSLARLETAEFHMERVIDLRQKQEHLMGLVDSQDAILLVAAARVSAGIDLQGVNDDAIDLDQETKSVTIRLPAPEVFDAALDEERTYVHSRSTDLLAERSEQLETEARQAAARRLQEAAVEAGLLRIARDNAKSTVTSLLHSLGFEHVEIIFEE
jgi:HSP20 family molecular chaperone IbpA